MNQLSGEKKPSTNNIAEAGVYQCIRCGGALHLENDRLLCWGCPSIFEVRDNIPILAEKERYWCNIPKDRMAALNADAEKGNWRDALTRHIQGNVLEHVASERRIDFRYILPPLEDKRILDIGAMWGGVTMPISGYAKEVCAIDTTYETLRFLSIRAKQDKVDNVKVALASAHKLPFAENHFDIVFMIGVLEWLGADYDFVVTEHYGKTRRDRPARTDPKELQARALSEVRRVLKPGGMALIAIENRFFYKHIFGSPDPHTAVPFSSILPRRAADLYMRLLKNQNYSEYTYSYDGYKRMFSRGLFDPVTIYAAIPSYRELDVIIPMDGANCINYYYENYGIRNEDGIKKIIGRTMLKLNLVKYFVPSFLILAEKKL